MVKQVLILFFNSFLLLQTDRAVAQNKRTGTIRGQVVDAARSGIEFASAVLLKLPDSSLIQGGSNKGERAVLLRKCTAREICIKNKLYRLCDKCGKRCSCRGR